MVATSRTRSFSGFPEKGWRIIGGVMTLTSRDNSFGSCDDVIGDFGGYHSLSIFRQDVSGSIYRSYLGPGGSQDWEYPLPFTATTKYSGAPTASSYVNRVLAQTGPLTATVNLPVALFELKDLPRMLKHAGDLLHKIGSRSGLNPAKEGAAATLAYQFGWGPLIQDIGRMMNLVDMIDKRQRMLQQAHSTKGIRRKINLDNLTSTHSGGELRSSTYGRFINQDYEGTKNVRTWGTVRWVTRDPSLFGKKPSFKEAFNTALGLNPGYIPISVWKAMPWSWAIDWFAGISDLINAYHNMVYYRPSRICIMRTWTNTWTYPHCFDAGGEVSQGSKIAVWKERTIHNPSLVPRIRFPFLDPYKLSILGSFAILAITGK
jgi:hypothetical protein